MTQEGDWKFVEMDGKGEKEREKDQYARWRRESLNKEEILQLK